MIVQRDRFGHGLFEEAVAVAAVAARAVAPGAAEARAVAARLGGAPLLSGAVRVTFWGALAMGCTALVGRLFGAST
jgi:VIT1/CCC1 family predicted Fe2+/Mn2+ transporter